MRRRICASALALVLAVGALLSCGARPAAAGPKSREKMWRIGTYLGAAGTGYALSRGKGTWALIGGAATYLSYRQWKNEVRKRHQRASLAGYRAYRTRWAQSHRTGRYVRRR